jgi:hypothetical protein
MHRIYGKVRLPRLLERWSFVSSWGTALSCCCVPLGDGVMRCPCLAIGMLLTDLDRDYESGEGVREKALKSPKQVTVSHLPLTK